MSSYRPDVRNVIAVAVLALLLSACSLGKSQPTPSPSLPPTPSPTPAASLTITPQTGPAFGTFAFDLSGLQPGEIVRFTIKLPTGKDYVGPPHTAASDGTVTAKYSTGTAGDYTVTANGDKGSMAQAMFTVTPASPPPHTAVPVIHHFATPTPTRRPTPRPTVKPTPKPTPKKTP